MSETEKKGNVEKGASSAIGRESQDFQLVDMDDEELPNADSLQKSLKGGAVNESLDSQVASDAKETEIQQTLTNDDPEENNLLKGKDEALEVTVEGKEMFSDEEDEILCTPPDSKNASKKIESVSNDIISNKRKVESDNETTELSNKVLKTSIFDDAKTLDKRKEDEENDENSCSIFQNNTMQANVLLPETQDIEETETQGIFTQDLDGKESVKCETNKKHFGSSDKQDKDENLNNAAKSVESMLTDTENLLTDGTGQEIASKTDDKAHSKINDKTKDTSLNNSEDKEKETKISSINVENKEYPSIDASDSAKENSETKSDEKDSDLIAIIDSDSNSIQDKVSLTEGEDLCSNNNSDVGKKRPLEDAQTEISLIANAKKSSASSKEISTPKKEKSSSKISMNSNKSRMSIEVIFDRCATDEKKSRPKELVEIDEEGEKIVLDSSQEDTESKSVESGTMAGEAVKANSHASKMSSEATEGSKDGAAASKMDEKEDCNGYKRNDTSTTVSFDSDLMSNESAELAGPNGPAKEKDKDNFADLKDVDQLLSISENEVNVSKDENLKNKSLTKPLLVEKEFGVFVKFKCLLQLDENSRELLGKELIAVQCESTGESSPHQKVSDTSTSLADISGKDSSPGSVHSNPQLFTLNPSRLSIVSSVSSSSSASSAASLAAKLKDKDKEFSLPKAPPKHAKKCAQDGVKVDEFERLCKEWKNSQLLVTNVLNFLNTEIVNENHNSSEQLDDQIQKILSSTPEVNREVDLKATPKSTRRNKPTKRPYNQENSLPSTPGKKNKQTAEEAKARKSTKSEASPQESSDKDVQDVFVGKEVFAKWSDNNYYPGKVVDKVKNKYKVNFYDGHSKLLIEGFVIRIPKILNKGLSVYATTSQDSYGSSGIIVDVEEDEQGAVYTVETDDKGKLKVRIKDIFLSPDQAQVFKEEVDVDPPSVPSTPKAVGQVTLDNTIDGKRRSRRVATPVFSTPKSRKRKDSSSGRSANNDLEPEPSGSGIAAKGRKLEESRAKARSEDLSSDSSLSVKEEVLFGVHPEIAGTPADQNAKAENQRKIKGKARSKKKSEDEEVVAKLGPIPRDNPSLFAGMSFILTCASVENIDRFRADNRDSNRDSNSETATENEEQWVQIPFVRDRLKAQLTAGGGKVYDEFQLIPQNEYHKTKLITNVPNNTAKGLLCLSVGIPSYNHKWVIRCCQQNTLVNPAEEELPSGWSLERQCYVEKFQRLNKKPLTNMVVIIPNVPSSKDFVEFWRQVCENAGAVVVLVENAESMEGFPDDTVVVTNHRCPHWAVEKAYNLRLPLLSTTWVVQCLVEGKVCASDGHPRYIYNYVQ